MWHDSCLHFGVGLVLYATLNCSFFCLVTIVQVHWLVTSFLFYFLSNSSLIFTLFFFCYSFGWFFGYRRKNNDVSVLVSSFSELSMLPPKLCLYSVFCWMTPIWTYSHLPNLGSHPSLSFIFLLPCWSIPQLLSSSVLIWNIWVLFLTSLSLISSPSSQSLSIINSDL